jgi:hypothetical protein
MSILDSIISEVGIQKKDSKKKSVPIEFDGSVDDICNRWIAAKNAITDAEVALKIASEQLRKVIEPARLAKTKNTGSIVKTIEVNGKLRYGIEDRYVVTNKADDIRSCYNVFYDELFESDINVSLTGEALKDEEFLEVLRSYLGLEKFKKMISVKVGLKLKPGYHEKRHLNPEIEMLHEKAESAGLVRCYAPKIFPLDSRKKASNSNIPEILHNRMSMKER